MRSSSLSAVILLALTSGCISLRIGEGDGDPVVRVDGVAEAYADVVGFDDYEGPLLGVDILNNLDRGEVAAVDLGPIFGVGVGVAGARLRVWPFEIGFGTLFYRPKPPQRTRRAEPSVSEGESGPDDLREPSEERDHDD